MLKLKAIKIFKSILTGSLVIGIMAVFISGCSDKTKTPEAVKETDKKSEQKKDTNQLKKTEAKEDAKKYAPQSEDELMSKNITNYLLNDYLKKDINGMDSLDRKFQMYKIDLNGDGKDEYFISLTGKYFCGSGGCTFLLINNEAEKIAAFSVTDAPIYVSPTKENGWNVLYLLSNGKYRKTVYGKKSYPSNPSVLPASDFKPGPEDKALFDNEKNPCKTYNF